MSEVSGQRLSGHFETQNVENPLSRTLMFADSVQVTGAPFEGGYLAPALRDSGRAWGRTGDKAAALSWTRSRPSLYMEDAGEGGSISQPKASAPL
jgi:hypothetical protein